MIETVKDKKLVLIIILGFTLRILMYFILPTIQFPDALEYYRVGQEFFKAGLMDSFKVMPMYPIWSYFSSQCLGGRFLDILVSTATIYYVYQLARYLLKNKRMALISAFLFAVYPFSIFYAISGLTESLFVFLSMAGLTYLYKKDLWKSFIFFVLSVLTRPSYDLVFPIIIAYTVIFVHGESFRGGLYSIGKYLMVYILLMSPWWIHNHIVYGSFVRLNLGDGIILYEANNISNVTGGPAFGKVDFNTFDSIPSLVARNSAMKKTAFEFMLSDPKRFLTISTKRFFRFWNPMPNSSEYVNVKYFVALLILPLYFAAIYFFINIKVTELKKWIPILIIFAFLTLIHTITVGSIRYRYSLEPFLLIMLGFTIVKVSECISSNKSPKKT